MQDQINEILMGINEIKSQSTTIAILAGLVTGMFSILGILIANYLSAKRIRVQEQKETFRNELSRFIARLRENNESKELRLFNLNIHFNKLSLMMSKKYHNNIITAMTDIMKKVENGNDSPNELKVENVMSFLDACRKINYKKLIL